MGSFSQRIIKSNDRDRLGLLPIYRGEVQNGRGNSNLIVRRQGHSDEMGRLAGEGSMIGVGQAFPDSQAAIRWDQGQSWNIIVNNVQ